MSSKLSLGVRKMDYGMLSLLPIVLTLTLVFYSRNVFISLLLGILSSTAIIGLFTGDYLSGLTSLATVFLDSGTTMTTFFVLMTGAIMNVVSKSGGVEGLVRFCTEKKKIVKSRFGAEMLTFILGLLLFVDGTSSISTTAIVGKPFFKKFGIKDEKLALISNSTGSAVAWIIPFGSACAVLTVFFTPVAKELAITDNPFSIVMRSTIFQFYTVALLLLLVLSIIFRFEIGPMRGKREDNEIENLVFETETSIKGKARAINMVLPLIFMVSTIFFLLIYTGNGKISEGNGGTAVFVSGLLTLLLSALLYKVQGITTINNYISWCMEGMKNMFDLTLILVLAYAFGSLLTSIGTAGYLSQYATYMPKQIMLVAGYIISSVIAYATGTSGGTAAVLVPVLVPLMYHIGINPMFTLGAIISGAVFGDQNSPISDSVILTSSMTGVDAMQHVKTQIPYTAIAWGCAFIGYIILGAI